VLALMLEDSKRRLQRRLTAVGMVVVERPHTCCHCMGRGEIEGDKVSDAKSLN
jgi:hypothetical protein